MSTQNTRQTIIHVNKQRITSVYASLEDWSRRSTIISVKMFLGDLHRRDVDVIHHLDFSDGLQILNTMLILDDLCVIDVNMEVVIVGVDFDLLGEKNGGKRTCAQFL